MSRLLPYTVMFSGALWLFSCDGSRALGDDVPTYADRIDIVAGDTRGLDSAIEFPETREDEVEAMDTVDAQIACPSGHIYGPDGSCMPVGIQGCVEAFLEEDGLCHPRIEKCPTGTIPKFDEGCVPVGIQGCADLFMEDDGLCHPRMDKCPPGTIPKFDEGCVQVGIQDCAAMFIQDDGLCHPTMSKCPEGTFAVPSMGCVPIDGPNGCGEGTWGNIADSPGTVYVDPGFSSGDRKGSREKPATTIAEALALVPEGGRMALAAGTYDEAIHITSGIEIVGRCPSLVLVQGVQESSGGIPATIWVESASDAAIHDLSIGGLGVGILAEQAPGLAVSGVHVNSAAIYGVYAIGPMTELLLSNSLIAGTNPRQSDQTLGVGVTIAKGAYAEISQSAIIANHSMGLVAVDLGTEAEVSEVIVEGTLSQASDDTLGEGVYVWSGATMKISESAVVGNRERGVYLGLADSVLEATSCIIEGTLPRASDLKYGRGVQVQDGALMKLSANVISDNRSVGIGAFSPGTQLFASGNLVSGTLPREKDLALGRGVVVEYGPDVRFSDNSIVANHAEGLFIAGALFDGERNIVEGTLPEASTLNHGDGVYAADGSHVELEGTALTGNHAWGMSIFDVGTEVVLSRSIVSGTLPQQSDLNFGRGIEVQSGASLDAIGNAIIGNPDVGLAATAEGTSLMLQGNLIGYNAAASADSEEGQSQLGWGVILTGGCEAVMEFNAVVSNFEMGIVAGSSATLVEARWNLVQNTVLANYDGGGGGFAVGLGADAELEGNAIVSNEGTGLLVATAPPDQAAEADGESEVSSTGDLIEGTLPDQSKNESGIGVAVQSGGILTMESAAVIGNHVAGIFVFEATATLLATLVRDTESGQVSQPGGEPIYGLGDGVIVLHNSTAAIEGTRVTGCARSGILYDQSSGSVSATLSGKNLFGLVLSGEPMPTVNDTNFIADNLEQDVWLDGDLDVPVEPLPLPDDG